MIDLDCQVDSDDRAQRPEIILASRSTGRAWVLRQVGIPFRVRESTIDEEGLVDADPVELVKKRALAKAWDVACREGYGIIVGADTVVVLDGRILGKPRDRDDAAGMLRALSGRSHAVISGVAVVAASGEGERPGHKPFVSYDVTEVWMHDLPEPWIEGYIRTGEPMGKAGAYGIQGRGGMLVRRISGCYFNVVGLPLARLMEAFREFDIDVFDTNV